MKTLEWQSFFEKQRERHGKTIFSVAELANAARTNLHALNTELGRLLARGIVARYAQGLYGPAKGVGVEDVLPAIDSGAYMTGFYVLFREHLVTQVPTQITCFTSRRHNRRTDVGSPAGRLKFICVKPPIYSKPPGKMAAPAEQAFCDFVWLNIREGIEPRSLVTFHKLNRLSQGRLNRVLERYPQEIQRVVAELTTAWHSKPLPQGRSAEQV